jgi:hypothetical protein
MGGLGISHPEPTPAAAASKSDGVTAQTRFHVKPAFRVILNMVGVDREQSVFTYADLVDHLSSYILEHKNILIDPRNISVVLCGSTDPLGVAFGVAAFHRSQVL